MKQSLSNFSDGAGEWAKSIRAIFTTAIELDGQITIWGKDVDISWPRFDDAVDLAFMTIEGETGDHENQKVRATLFPGILEKGSEKPDCKTNHCTKSEAPQ